MPATPPPGLRRRQLLASLSAPLISACAPTLPPASAAQAPDAPLRLAAPRAGRSRPLVAVLGENRYTELTDYVIPYGVLQASGAAEVVALGTQAGPIRLFPALQLQAQASIAAFDAAHPEGADLLVVPAVHHDDDPTLLAWVRDQAAKGATVLGVCDGVWVLARAGLLQGRQAVGHWYSRDDLARKFPHTRWVADRRYLADGPVITTTGVTASLPVSLALVQAMAGPAVAQPLAARLGLADWSARHRSADFQLRARHLGAAAGNWLRLWDRERLGLPLQPGMDELGLALLADAHARTWCSEVLGLAAGPVRSRGGLLFLPDRNGPEPGLQTLSLPPDQTPVAVLQAALARIRARHGAATADFVALQMEYPGA